MTRFGVLLLSIFTLVLFGKALAGLGGYAFGRGRPDYIVAGLVGGTASGFAAVLLWKEYLKELAGGANEKHDEE